MGMPEDRGTRTIEHERTWMLSEVLSLTVPEPSLTVREYLVTLTAKDAMDQHLADWPEHISAFDADCDAIVQHMIRPEDGELCLRVWVRLLAFDPREEPEASG
jgi:hypothetical protein